MSFLSPMFLLGLPLLAVPVLIHLLNRRQQKRLDWGAMRFLLQAATRRRRLWRLTDLLLLILRVLALLFFVFALARPLLPVNWLGGSGPREVILIIDQSMSTAQREGDQTLFALQLEKARQLMRGLTARDTIRVLLAGETPEWLLAEPVAATSGVITKVGSELAELQPTLGSADIAASVREALELEVAEDKIARIISVVTDGQAYGWRLEEGGFWKALKTQRDKARVPTTINLHVIGSAERNAANLSIDKVDAPRASGSPEQVMTFKASIRNHGTNRSPPSLLSWFANTESLGVSSIPELEPGAETSATVNHTFNAPGLVEITCQLGSADSLEPDNKGQFLFEVWETMPIIIVDDAPSADPLQTETGYLLAAFGVGGSGASGAWRSAFDPKVVDSTSLENLDLAKYRAVIMANVAKVSPTALEKIANYVQGGGGLWIALGGKTDAPFYNQHLYADGAGLAPMAIQAAVGDPDNHEVFSTLSPPSEVHTATAMLADTERLDLDRVRVYRRYPFDNATGKDVSVLLRVQDGSPVAVEKSVGRGRVIVQSIPLGVAWNTLPLSQAYVALVHEWLWYLAEPSLPKRNLRVGDALRERLVAPQEADTASLARPDNKTIDLAVNPGEADFRYAGTRLPGSYTMSLRRQDAEIRATKFVVQRDPLESNLAPLDSSQLQTLEAATGFRLNPGAIEAPGETSLEMPRHPLAGWLLFILAMLFFAELAVAGLITYRRSRPTAPVQMHSRDDKAASFAEVFRKVSG